ncbi:YbjQ family protein [Paenibacillus segetis]|uniref:UPF0145 protein GCM10008013_25090 n=1 Tax=Paenibacillus segetis TaxID=1325360 RepID=A0ABQ1YG73_9BACL|nr:YbjQ family protein [Paenibacillus segetis]GGH25038.1 hypothetical protein GCM10008013_25090 [Paenibacillus segetis]
MTRQKMIISTTSSLEGIDILQYKGIISARVVTGTGIFSDFVADFSDMFGGRSGTYQKQLKSIYDEVIELLQSEAKKVSANAIIGVRIDHDEISGKGKQMFMVTASGTAVITDSGTTVLEEDEDIQEITNDRLEFEINKMRVIKQVKENSSLITEHISFFTQNRIVEVMEDIINYCINTELYEDLRIKIVEYMKEIGEPVESYLYTVLQTTRRPDRVFSLLVSANMMDYSKMNEYLLSASFEHKRLSLESLMSSKSSYNASDVEKIEELINTLVKEFTNRGKILDHEKWQCECGKVNKVSNDFCKSCYKDIRGFDSAELRPEKVIEVLEERQLILRGMFAAKIFSLT